MSDPERDQEMREMTREVLRELVPGMLKQVIAESAAQVGNGAHNGHNGDERRATGRQPDAEAAVVPQVPAPPVAAVLRPSTWDRAPAPGEIIGAGPADDPPARHQIAQPAVRGSVPSPGAQPEVSISPRATVTSDSPPATVTNDSRREVVVIETDDDLERFVRQLTSRLENPRERLALRTGRLRFTLRRPPAAAGGATGSAAPAMRVEKGAVTERMIRAAAADGTRLVLAPGAVLTPLAREQAKARGVQIEREPRC